MFMFEMNVLLLLKVRMHVSRQLEASLFFKSRIAFVRAPKKNSLVRARCIVCIVSVCSSLAGVKVSQFINGKKLCLSLGGPHWSV